MVREIIQIGNETLLEVSKRILPENIQQEKIQSLISDLIDTCNAEGSSAGLSAIQIGVPKRVFIARAIDDKDDSDVNPKWLIMINPEIEVLDDTPSTAWEGCLSIGQGDERLFGPVPRPRKIRVEYLDEEGREQNIVAKDYFAHIIQHEFDHLEGKLFLSYIDNPTNIWKSVELDDYISQHDSYPNIE